MKKFIIILSIFITAFTTNLKANNIAFIDLATVIIFHPIMKNYVFEIERFVNYFPENLSESERKEYLKKIEIEKQQKLIAVETKLNAIYAQREFLTKEKDEKLFEKHNNGLNTLKKKYELLILQNSDKKSFYLDEMEKQIDILENNIAQESKKLSDQIDALTTAYNKLIEEQENLNYGSEEETTKLITQIKNEINEAIEITAKKNDYQIVLNNWNVKFLYDEESAHLKEYINLNKDNEKDKIKDLDVNELFYSKFFSINNNNDLNSIESDNNLAKSDIEAYIDEFAYLKSWYENKVKLTSLFQAGFLNKFVVYGGEDITYHVLNEILLKYKISREKRASLLKFVKETKDDIEFSTLK